MFSKMVLNTTKATLQSNSLKTGLRYLSATSASSTPATHMSLMEFLSITAAVGATTAFAFSVSSLSITLEPISIENKPTIKSPQNINLSFTGFSMLLKKIIALNPDLTKTRYKSYSQLNLIEELEKENPNFKLEGLCYGMETLWYIYQCIGKDLTVELQKIDRAQKEKIPLSLEQKRIIRNIYLLQTYQLDATFYVTVNETMELRIKRSWYASFTHFLSLYLARNSNKSLEEVVDEALDLCCKQNNALIDLLTSINNRSYRHILGVTSVSDNKIKYFDANLGEVVCDNKQVAQKSILSAMALGRIIPEPTPAIMTRTIEQKRHYGFFGYWSPASKESLAAERNTFPLR